jgi:Zn-dependent protease
MNFSLLSPAVLASIAAIVVAVTLHELGHGFAAYAMGDPTARNAGRLSFNPLRHVDLIGTVLLPGFLVVSQLIAVGRVVFLFGWAKPVPVNPTNFVNPRQQMALVAACGPLVNFCLAYLAALGFHIAPNSLFLAYSLVANIALGLFNLIPVPPLDGGRIAVGILPLPLARRWARLERWGLPLVILLLFLAPRIAPLFGASFDPLGNTGAQMVGRAVNFFLNAAGVAHG